MQTLPDSSKQSMIVTGYLNCVLALFLQFLLIIFHSGTGSTKYQTYN